MTITYRICAVVICCLFATSGAVSAAAADQTAEIIELKRQLAALLQRVEQMERQQQQVSDQQVQLAEQQDAMATTVEAGGGDPLLEWARNSRIGGYGELHFNQLDSKDEIDFHRFVLYFGHTFSDQLRFFSELELEHSLAGEGKKGEIEIEQAFIEYDLNGSHRAKGGLFLVPVGILNETHEPDSFYGVERNNVERNILPTTWWEAGAALSGELGNGFQYDVALHSGLGLAPGRTRIRDGRLKVSEAPAKDPAYTARLKYTAIPGLELAGTAQFQEDITQSNPARDQARALLLETHAVYNRGPFGLRALFATWDIDSDEFDLVNRDQQSGWYVEPSWRLNQQFGLFSRYSEWDNEAGGGGNSINEQIDLGFNWWPHPHVVLKFDWLDLNAPAGSSDDDGFNLGIGYSF